MGKFTKEQMAIVAKEIECTLGFENKPVDYYYDQVFETKASDFVIWALGNDIIGKDGNPQSSKEYWQKNTVPVEVMYLYPLESDSIWAKSNEKWQKQPLVDKQGKGKTFWDYQCYDNVVIMDPNGIFYFLTNWDITYKQALFILEAVVQKIIA